MKIDYLPSALKALEDAPADVRRAFFKQVRFLERDLRYPSLQAKKYDVGDTYIIRDIIPHPK
jgi:mRNA-degrading endonuclease RelE of RelBE toxin-antitoxin system